ncbi:hypothetical protein DRO54_06670 [Candidatus Bathyarchaeota archaeon]|nr:MAG: hypothetical protein DRO54_06670 [Candidatus Bathyarchaeota archaeon]
MRAKILFLDKIKKTVVFPKKIYLRIERWRSKYYKAKGEFLSFSGAVVELVKRGLKGEIK